ncbi:MAG: hypothetical protein AAFY82_00015 [Pseudomonadota bacterium]
MFFIIGVRHGGLSESEARATLVTSNITCVAENLSKHFAYFVTVFF